MSLKARYKAAMEAKIPLQMAPLSAVYSTRFSPTQAQLQNKGCAYT